MNNKFCFDSCIYSKINYAKLTADCHCIIEGQILDDEEEKEITLLDNIFNLINYKLFKCYNKILEIEGLFNNTGACLGLLFIICEIILSLIFLLSGIDSLYSKLYGKIKEKKENKREKISRLNDYLEAVNKILNRKRKENDEKNAENLLKMLAV